MDNTKRIESEIAEQERKNQAGIETLTRLRESLDREKERVASVQVAAVVFLKKCWGDQDHEWVGESYDETSQCIDRGWSRGDDSYGRRSYDSESYVGYRFSNADRFGYGGPSYHTTFESKLECKKCHAKATVTRG